MILRSKNIYNPRVSVSNVNEIKRHPIDITSRANDIPEKLEYKGKLALCFLVVQNVKNIEVFRKWWAGYEDYINIYSHISGKYYDDSTYEWNPELWSNRVDVHGIPHIPTKWGEMSLVKAESLIYKCAIENKDNRFFCLLSESDIPVRSFPEVYNNIINSKKSYLTYQSSRSNDSSLFLDCFPEKFIPSSYSGNKWENLRRWRMYNANQWKILNRRDAKEFIKMASDNEYMDSYDNCFDFVPESLAPDEYAYPNWISLKYGSAELKKRFKNFQTTFVSFDKKAIHALEYSDIPRDVKDELCDSVEEWNMFARKFIKSDKLINKIPLKCSKKYGRKYSFGHKKSRGPKKIRSHKKSRK